MLLKEGTFFAKIVLRRGPKEIEIDARPSDAIAIAVACNAPMFAAEEVIAAASASPTELMPPSVEGIDDDEDADDDEDEMFGESDESTNDS